MKEKPCCEKPSKITVDGVLAKSKRLTKKGVVLALIIAVLFAALVWAIVLGSLGSSGGTP